MNANRNAEVRYHKQVWALKIAGIVGDQHGGVYFQPLKKLRQGAAVAGIRGEANPKSAATTWFMRTATSRFHRLVLSRADIRACDG